MTSVLKVLEGGKKLLPLCQRLLVAINIHGTIAEVSTSRPVTLKPRPFLSYLLHTLCQLHCDTHFITTLNPCTEGKAVERFFQQHLVGENVFFRYHIHYETPSTYVSSSLAHSSSSRDRGGYACSSHHNRTETTLQGNGKRAPICRHSLTPLLLRRALAIGSSPDHIFCVDTEVNYRFPVLQTVVLEPFAHYTPREMRKVYREYMADAVQQGLPKEGGGGIYRRCGRSSDSEKWEMGNRAVEENGMGRKRKNKFVLFHEEERQRMLAKDGFLREEFLYASYKEENITKKIQPPPQQEREKQEEIASETSTRIRHSSRATSGHHSTAAASSGVRGRADINLSEEKATATPEIAAGSPKADPAAIPREQSKKEAEKEDHHYSRSPSSSSSCVDVGGASPLASSSFTSSNTTNTQEMGLVAYHSPLPSQLLKDYICVALATFLTELSATSATTVKDFLQKEPLLEQLRVPMHGTCFYLAKENCQDLEMVNWDEVEVVMQKEEKNQKNSAEKTSSDGHPSVRDHQGGGDDLFFQ